MKKVRDKRKGEKRTSGGWKLQMKIEMLLIVLLIETKEAGGERGGGEQKTSSLP